VADAAIRVENLSKRYVLGRQSGNGGYVALRDVIADSVKSAGRRLLRPGTKSDSNETEFWALKDVSFSVAPGEVVGVIGRNGAGKSTLLKVLSRITEPTSGRITINGRVASLLEVGTGFHPELTGRENIYLNGAILGMARTEIKRQFDEIVAFAEVERFLDTPVKRYSSGMYVRLAFAVAAHLNPEILIVDEVLAVGDAEFQRKCLGKMQDVATSGRTVLFVSHNMHSISLLCTTGIMLQRGEVLYQGGIQGAIDAYLSSFVMGTTASEQNPDAREGTGEYRFMEAQPKQELFDTAEPKEVQFRIERRKGSVGRMCLSAHILDNRGTILMQCDGALVGAVLEDAAGFTGTFGFTSPWLKPGTYQVDMFLYVPGAGIIDRCEGACNINISPLLPYPNSVSEGGTSMGVVFADFSWETAPLGERGHAGIPNVLTVRPPEPSTR